MFGNRKAVGSLIGEAFLVLILITNFSFMQMKDRVTLDYTSIVEDMSERDRLQALERLEISSVELTPQNILVFTLRNAGQSLLTVNYIEIFNTTMTQNTQDYYQVDVSLNPAGTLDYASAITLIPSTSYSIQLLTELGNAFYTTHPPTSQNGNTSATAIISITAGSIIAETNPLFTNADISGEFELLLKSSTTSGETFNRTILVGSLSEVEVITQLQ